MNEEPKGKQPMKHKRTTPKTCMDNAHPLLGKIVHIFEFCREDKCERMINIDCSSTLVHVGNDHVVVRVDTGEDSFVCLIPMHRIILIEEKYGEW